jgi:exodeoxyribonuclease VII large subunit
VIKEIAGKLPTNENDFKRSINLDMKKAEKYIPDILSIINNTNIPSIEKDSEEEVYSVSQFLDELNRKLCQVNVVLRGEISSVTDKGHVYFSLKDQVDESVINCLIWKNNYSICGIELEQGMEVIIRGIPEIYKPTGRMTFKASTIELVGEGALKKAYIELRKKLDAEGLFDEERKKAIPALPTRIGLITSREGAVIHDFQTNLGRFGYKIKFVNSRVEGVLAVKDLIRAVKFFKGKEIDILVIIRGGGSLESLQAFNNEALIREIIDYPIPIICGIGHDKDVPLFCLAADKAVSTPSIVASTINRTWEHAVDKITFYETNMIHNYSNKLSIYRNNLDNLSFGLNKHFQSIFKKVSSIDQTISNIFNKFTFSSRELSNKFVVIGKNIINSYSSHLVQTSRKIENSFRVLKQNNPDRLLSMGYSITLSGGKIIKSIEQITMNTTIISKFYDGQVTSLIENIEKRKNG